MKATHILFACGSAAFLCGVNTSRLLAQDDPKPKEPLLARAPSMSAWTITYHYKPVEGETKPEPGTGAKPVDQIVSVQIEKTGMTYHRVTNWSAGGRSDAWTIDQKQVLKERNVASYVIMPNTGPATDDYSKSDFEDIAWISMKYYAGFKKEGQGVFVFQAKNKERPMTRREKLNLSFMTMMRPLPMDNKPKTGGAATSPAAPAQPDAKTMLEQYYGDSVATVALDVGTQLPVGYDDGKITCAYQFTTPPTDPLIPPPEVQKLLRRWEDYVRGTTTRPSTP